MNENLENNEDIFLEKKEGSDKPLYETIIVKESNPKHTRVKKDRQKSVSLMKHISDDKVKFSDKLLSLDRFGLECNFSFNRYRYYISTVGFIASLLCYILFGLVIYYFLMDFANETRVTVKEINYANLNNFELDYSEYNFDIGFYVYYDNVLTTSPLNYVYIAAELIKDTRSTSSQTNTVELTQNLTSCTSLRSTSNIESLNTIYSWRSGALCLSNLSDYYSKNLIQSDTQYYVKFKVHILDNYQSDSTFLPTRLKVQLLLIENKFDFEKYKNPRIYKLNTDYYNYLDTSFTKTRDFYMQKLQQDTDNGFFFNSTSSQFGAVLDHHYSDTLARSSISDEVLSFTFYAVNNIKAFSRKYTYFYMALSNIYGIIKVVFVTVGSFFYWYHTIMLTTHIVDKTRSDYTYIEQKTGLYDLIIYEMIDRGWIKGKSAYYMENKRHFDLSTRMVEKQQDVENIVNNSIQLDAIKHALLKPYQSTQIPYVILKDFDQNFNEHAYGDAVKHLDKNSNESDKVHNSNKMSTNSEKFLKTPEKTEKIDPLMLI